MIYERYFERSERSRWSLEDDIRWAEIDRAAAEREGDTLAKLRDAAIIESYAPIYALKGLKIWWNSVEESAIASIQFYEEYKHFFALKRYLEHAGISISDREVVEVREPNAAGAYPDRVRQLANYMISEHFTAYFYAHLLEGTREPVLRTLLEFLVADERRHCSVFYSLLEARIAADRAVIPSVIDEVMNFRHQAEEVIGERVPVAMKNDFEAMLHLWHRVERLTGVDLREAKKNRQHELQDVP